MGESTGLEPLITLRETSPQAAKVVSLIRLISRIVSRMFDLKNAVHLQALPAGGPHGAVAVRIAEVHLRQ